MNSDLHETLQHELESKGTSSKLKADAQVATWEGFRRSPPCLCR